MIRPLRQQVSANPELAARVQLSQQAADDLSGLPAHHFDTIVLNSVAQYFPDGAYLIEVIRQLLGLLAPGGSLFLGDLRNLRSHRMFQLSLRMPVSHHLEPSLLRQELDQAMMAERELLIDPALFGGGMMRSEQVRELAAHTIAQGRIATVDDIAAAVPAILSEAFQWATGSVIDLPGGQSL